MNAREEAKFVVDTITQLQAENEQLRAELGELRANLRTAAHNLKILAGNGQSPHKTDLIKSDECDKE
jgi:cell division septum initiation protein DivIVA